MPGTENDVPGDEPLGQGSGPVSASVLDGMKGAANVEQRHLGALQHDTGGLSGRKIVGTNGFHHCILGGRALSSEAPSPRDREEATEKERDEAIPPKTTTRDRRMVVAGRSPFPSLRAVDVRRT